MSTKKTASFPILGILGLIFITLKLAGIGIVSSWSWIWVLSPFWIPLVVVLGVIGVIWLAAVVLMLFNK